MPTNTHEQLLDTLVEKVRVQDSQTAASTAVFLAQQPKITRDEARFLAHCDPAAGRIDWASILEHRGWSLTEAIMLKVAAWLDDADVSYDPATLDRLDEHQSAVLDAMRLAHNTSTVPADLIDFR